ncbi:protein kinase [Pantoea sp. Fr+CA_20]|uniref:serine/threonine protein kinase n=1 Tax=Pantoea sp. Fr+CA_20 TaxID=2929506 RepID=UPI002117F942|nr:protein kinase [Pantoea sp. Fr+CA_20]
MPALDEAVIDDVKNRLSEYLLKKDGYDSIEFLDAGGSAAVFKVIREGNVRAIKVFDPKFFSGEGNLAERRRLQVQKRLINHNCPSLVQTYHADEAEGTAIIDMEYLAWPQLAKVLNKIPDDDVIPLIGQLVLAVRYLESLNIVHRDIKPENIHVSDDFKRLKLLDLGVVRVFDNIDEQGITDHGNIRPFLATAQYSSPEYLFRLDEPTEKLWRGLNFYQVGAVLHDLIKKEPIFHHEVSLGNRWLVARAVLSQKPIFSDTNINRLSKAKALSLRCLSKDIDTRLSLVTWEDFKLEETSDPLASLKGRLSRSLTSQSNEFNNNETIRLKFERDEYVRKTNEKIRSELIDVCGNQLPLVMTISDEVLDVHFAFTYLRTWSLTFQLNYRWKDGIHKTVALISLGAILVREKKQEEEHSITLKPCLEVKINEGEDDDVKTLSNEIALIIRSALDLIDALPDDGSDINLDLGLKEILNER